MSKRKIAAGCRLSAMTLAAQIVNLPDRRLAAGRASVWLRSADCQSVSHSRLPVVLWQTSRCLGDCGEQWPFSLTLDPSPAGRGKPPVVAGGICIVLPSVGHKFSTQRQTVLPLPAGEGRGEGEHTAKQWPSFINEVSTGIWQSACRVRAARRHAEFFLAAVFPTHHSRLPIGDTADGQSALRRCEHDFGVRIKTYCAFRLTAGSSKKPDWRGSFFHFASSRAMRLSSAGWL